MYDKSGMIGVNSEKVENFFDLIKEEYRNQYAFLLQEKGDDGEIRMRGSIPIQVYNAAWLYANNNPHHFVMDGANEENLMQSLETYTNIIYNGLQIDSSGNFNRDANGFDNPNFNPNTGTTVVNYDRDADRYRILPAYVKDVTNAGLDLAGLNEAFQNKNSTSLSSLVPNANKNSWIGYLNNPDSEFYNIFDIPKLISEQGANTRYILLDRDVNLSLAFEDFGFD